ncbi:hypothetical protein Dimus_003041 [Dionaea muscipula]
MKSVADFDGLKSVADFVGVGVNNRESDLLSSNHHRLTSIYNFCINLWMHLCNSLSMPSSTFSWLIVLESWGSQLFYHLYREMFPVSSSKWKSLEVHHIKHPVVSASDSSGLPDLSFTRLQPTDQEFEGLKRNYFVWYVACEAAPDEEYSDIFLAACRSPLGINVVYAESSRLFAKRQVHPFFSQWKVGKSTQRIMFLRVTLA